MHACIRLLIQESNSVAFALLSDTVNVCPMTTEAEVIRNPQMRLNMVVQDSNQDC